MHAAASSGFHQTPTLLARWPGSPPELGRRFRRGEPRLPRRPGPHAPESPRSGGFVCFEALLPPRVGTRTAPLSQPPHGPSSPGLGPSRAFLRSSLGPSSDPADHSVRRGLAFATTKGATPRRQVKPGRPCGRHDLVGVRRAGLLRTDPCRLSAAALPPSTLERPTVTERSWSSEV
jgi:hypothetical protein